MLRVLLHMRELLLRRRHSLGSGTLFGGQRCRDRLAQLMLHMEAGRRVMHPEVVFDIRQQPWRFVTRRLDDVALERRQGCCHEGTPGVLISCLCGVL